MDHVGAGNKAPKVFTRHAPFERRGLERQRQYGREREKSLKDKPLAILLNRVRVEAAGWRTRRSVCNPAPLFRIY